jgi:hypothetical protein
VARRQGWSHNRSVTSAVSLGAGRFRVAWEDDEGQQGISEVDASGDVAWNRPTDGVVRWVGPEAFYDEQTQEVRWVDEAGEGRGELKVTEDPTALTAMADGTLLTLGHVHGGRSLDRRSPKGEALTTWTSLSFWGRLWRSFFGPKPKWADTEPYPEVLPEMIGGLLGGPGGHLLLWSTPLPKDGSFVVRWRLLAPDGRHLALGKLPDDLILIESAVGAPDGTFLITAMGGETWRCCRLSPAGTEDLGPAPEGGQPPVVPDGEGRWWLGSEWVRQG